MLETTFMPAWFSGDIDVNGIRIHYSRTGGNKPPLVLSHGASDSGLCWTRLARTLESEYDIILPDARGHGLSGAPESGYSSADRAADLAGLIGGLGLRRPALGGHSMGAATTLRLVADYPDLASCAILEDPSFWAEEGQWRAPGAEDPRDRIRRVVLEARANGLEATIARGRAASPSWADEEFGPWGEAKLRVSQHFLDDLSARSPADEWRALLPRVSCPVLLVTGDPERGGIVTPEIAQQARGLLPTLRVVRLSGAGHNVRREQFEAFTPALREFLAETYGPASSTTSPKPITTGQSA
ncbi:MAG: alpha/beta hydrolase [Chloroflexota bacterium]|nr:alpha/beta hydrolase [Chloroflexota bacterium]